MNLGKTREEDLEALKNEYSLQLASYKVKSEEYSKEINTLKSKVIYYMYYIVLQQT